MKEQTYGGIYSLRGYADGGDINGGHIHTEGKYTQRRHTNGGDIHTEEAYTRGGHILRGDIHMIDQTCGGIYMNGLFYASGRLGDLQKVSSHMLFIANVAFLCMGKSFFPSNR